MMSTSKRKSCLKLTSEEARAFFLDEKQYFTLRLPRYISFQTILKETYKFLADKNLSNLVSKDMSKSLEKEEINHILYHGKDAKYSWRPFTILHPIYYIELVKLITEEESWKLIVKRFKVFQKNKNIECCSIPIWVKQEENQKEQNTAEQIRNWWNEVEQKSLYLSADFDYLFHADIANCYSSIYTHSIPWALHQKDVAKQYKQDASLLGNQIDWTIQNFSHGQTNGIPQGSTLYDFIAEIVLGYADSELSKQISKCPEITDYKILRYRDDYRIFTNSKEQGRKILKLLTTVLIELGLQLNTNKSVETEDLITNAIKPDKIYWNSEGLSNDKNLQQELLRIHQLSLKFPNSGSLVKALSKYSKKSFKLSQKAKKPLIAIVVDILFRNPKCYPNGMHILSSLIKGLKLKDKESLLQKINAKFEKIPTTGYYEIWLQRLASKIDLKNKDNLFKEELCLMVQDETANTKKKRSNDSLWNSTWVNDKKLKKIIEKTPLVSQETMEKLPEVIEYEEVNIFPIY
jgi:RNA-directed DNA polymerase